MSIHYAVGYATSRLAASKLLLNDAARIPTDEPWSATALRGAITVALEHVTEALNALEETKETA